jgi:hypothetical protein
VFLKVKIIVHGVVRKQTTASQYRISLNLHNYFFFVKAHQRNYVRNVTLIFVYSYIYIRKNVKLHNGCKFNDIG